MHYLIEWDVCVNCARFLHYTNNWKDGWYYDVMHDDELFESWIGVDWQVLQRIILDGEFCESCSLDWEKFNAVKEEGRASEGLHCNHNLT